MAALCRADVLKPDEVNYPTHYNRAYSTVLGVLEKEFTEPALERAVDRWFRKLLSCPSCGSRETKSDERRPPEYQCQTCGRRWFP